MMILIKLMDVYSLVFVLIVVQLYDSSFRLVHLNVYTSSIAIPVNKTMFFTVIRHRSISQIGHATSPPYLTVQEYTIEFQSTDGGRHRRGIESAWRRPYK